MRDLKRFQKPCNLVNKGFQTGAILVMFTIGIFAIVAVAALALDGGHLLLSKGRLQNAVDAAALSAAKDLQGGATLYEAREAAYNILLQNLNFGENAELKSAASLTLPDFNQTQVTTRLQVEFSVLPDPFSAVLAEGSEYVRVSVENVPLSNFLADILDFNKEVRASAVAGRSQDLLCINKVVPLLVCGEPGSTAADNYGLAPGLHVMKVGSGAPSANGAGNFQLISLNGDRGGGDLRDAFSGTYSPDECVGEGLIATTKTGNTVGPAAQGMNTRFGVWGQAGTNSVDNPRDTNICEGTPVTIGELQAELDGVPVVDEQGHPVMETVITDSINAYSWAQYDSDNRSPVEACATTDNEHAITGRRELSVVVGVCDPNENGSYDIDIMGTACFFLTQQVGGNGQSSYIVGEFLNVCKNTGTASLEPNFVGNSSTIVLYWDPDSPDS
ncbi:pilus assembly protein TadG-related protein [Shewanella abyssi]|uniref:pilus assembly protein TadG-related protein n=1 Tax=Shewanella abyssi TaxID=311789 RepID=UPI00200E3BF3|nr:pilus assembly protein TadG-related protein [Shewanella abyssi]MCL1048202.1 pilus assembly protein TadG-related protein [Shewanella abyssi]